VSFWKTIPKLSLGTREKEALKLERMKLNPRYEERREIISLA